MIRRCAQALSNYTLLSCICRSRLVCLWLYDAVACLTAGLRPTLASASLAKCADSSLVLPCHVMVVLHCNTVLPVQCVDGATPAVQAQNGKAETSAPTEDDDNTEPHQERRESNGKATTSATAVPVAKQKSVAQDRKRKQPSDTGTGVQLHRTESGAAGGVLPGSGGNQTSATMTASTQKLSKGGSASITDDSTEAAQTAAASSKPAVWLQSNQTALLPPFALPGSASAPSASPRLPSRTSSILGGASTSTRISLPPKLTQLTTLRSKAPLQELKSGESPSDNDSEAEEAAAAAAAAATAVEAHLKAVTQQFDALLQNTLQRTKDSVHRVTQFAVRAAAGKHGKTAAHRLVIMILDTIETAHMSKRVDLFYLLDSLLQVQLVWLRANMNLLSRLFPVRQRALQCSYSCVAGQSVGISHYSQCCLLTLCTVQTST